jgi:tRNA (cytosine38-C5)-methyltransferase
MASQIRDRLRAVEFYAGVGGFHYSLLRSEISADVVTSFDLNPTANEIYRHNFPNTAHLNRNICGLSASELDRLEPDLMHMSPPCQPFTRQGLRRDKDDRRTDSFFHLMLIISEMRSPPNYILMENVQGFETSHTRNEFTEMLQRVGYSYQEFLLSPNQFGVPNSRLRYYLLAKKKPLAFALRLAKQPSSDAHVLLDFLALSSHSVKSGLSQCLFVCLHMLHMCMHIQIPHWNSCTL